tara:strand:- start:1030 stop:1749 length:720 start_codon:yes stop_codon:yes gene_type:complete
MSFSLSNISGSQIQKDSFINNLTVACDPGLLAPKTDPLTGLPNPLNLEKRDGKAAIGVDICDLDVSDLTVHGNLVVKGSAEVCDIVCPVDFSVTAGRDILQKATRSVQLTGGSRGVNLNFNATSSTDSLGITQANGTVAEAQAGNVNGVCGQLNVDTSITVFANSLLQLTLKNNKVTPNSVVLVTLDTTALGPAELLIISTSSIVSNEYTVNLANITPGNINISDVIIHYLVINPPFAP